MVGGTDKAAPPWDDYDNRQSNKAHTQGCLCGASEVKGAAHAYKPPNPEKGAELVGHWEPSTQSSLALTTDKTMAHKVCSEQPNPPGLEGQGSMHTPGCPTWNPLLPFRSGDKPGTECTHTNWPAKTVWHTVYTETIFSRLRDSYSIQLKGTNIESQTRYTPN